MIFFFWIFPLQLTAKIIVTTPWLSYAQITQQMSIRSDRVEATQTPLAPPQRKKSKKIENLVRFRFYVSISLITQLQHSKQLATTVDIPPLQHIYTPCNYNDFKKHFESQYFNHNCNKHFEWLRHVSCNDIQCVGIAIVSASHISNYKHCNNILTVSQIWNYKQSVTTPDSWSCNQTLPLQQYSKQSVTTPGTGGTHAMGNGSPPATALIVGRGSRGGSTSPSGVAASEGDPTGLCI
jgi:hypothetical protein